jgi:hypothetical protein
MGAGWSSTAALLSSRRQQARSVCAPGRMAEILKISERVLGNVPKGALEPVARIRAEAATHSKG